MTAGRLKLAQEIIGNAPFLLTYGDGVADINIPELVDFHKKHKGLVTLTAVKRPNQFGVFRLKPGQNTISEFREKPTEDSRRINGGFFVVQPEALDYIDSTQSVWEEDTLDQIAKKGKLVGFRHDGFWHCMDTPHDREALEILWKQDSVPWKIWN